MMVNLVFLEFLGKWVLVVFLDQEVSMGCLVHLVFLELRVALV